MISLLPKLYYPSKDTEYLDDTQTIVLGVTAYLCAILFFSLFVFAIYNTWMYLIK